MPYYAYKERKFHQRSLRLISHAISICEEYAQQGYDLTLRQLYYQFVARGLIPNTQAEYNKLGSVINDARLAGMLDWNWITDRTRNLQGNSHWEDPADLVEAAARQFAIDKWAEQSEHIEVWVEKEALAGVIERSARALDISHFSCRGYVSQSEMWAAGQRLLRKLEDDKHVTILHLGDHDPSGIDMTRDIDDRLWLFIGSHLAGSYEDGQIRRSQYRERVTINRIALNWDQVQQYQPPPNPAKITDSRARAYIDTYGTESWELDALDPATLDQLVTDAVLALRDQQLWDDALHQESEHRQTLTAAASDWDRVAAFLNGQP